MTAPNQTTESTPSTPNVDQESAGAGSTAPPTTIGVGGASFPIPKTGRVRFYALRGRSLSHARYESSAPLSFLSQISKADVYDQNANVEGTQRSLKEEHAAQAHAYAQGADPALNGERPRYFPEVTLNAREWDGDHIAWEPVGEPDVFGNQPGYLSLDIDYFAGMTQADQQRIISRMDGNHRLYFGDGHDAKYEPVNAKVPFALLVVPWTNRAAELQAFVDIHTNLTRMDASHLQTAVLRVKGQENVKANFPSLWIADRLSNDVDSPFHNGGHGVLKGNGSRRGYLVKLNQLTTAVAATLNDSRRVRSLTIEVQYEIVRQFWAAVRGVFLMAFSTPNRYLVLKSPGFPGLGRACATLAEHGLSQGKIEPATGRLRDPEFFRRHLSVVLDKFEWASGNVQPGPGKKSFYGFQGLGGADQVAQLIIAELNLDGPTESIGVPVVGEASAVHTPAAPTVAAGTEA